MAKTKLINYTQPGSEASLKTIVEQMKEYGRNNSFNAQDKIAEAKATGNVVDEFGPMTRVTGEGQYDLIAPYSRFITLDGKTPLQITYYEYNKPNTLDHVAQLTVMDNQQNVLDPHLIQYLCYLFFGGQDFLIPPVKVPPHVFLALQLVKTYDPWASPN